MKAKFLRLGPLFAALDYTVALTLILPIGEVTGKSICGWVFEVNVPVMVATICFDAVSDICRMQTAD